MKSWKALLGCLVLSILTGVNVYAASNKNDSGMIFGNVKYYQNGEYVTVEAEVSNKTSAEKTALLVVASYDSDGRAYNFNLNSQSLGAGENLLLKTENYLPKAGCKVKAFVMESFFGNEKMPMPAELGADSTDLAYILINGKPLEGFSNDKYRYTVPKTADFFIEAVAKDNTTAVAITKGENPDIYEITATASDGSAKTFTVAAYDRAQDTLAISKIIYKADNETEYHTIDFEDVIELPENAKTVEIKAVAEYSSSVSYYVVNNATASPIEEVSYGTLSAAARTALSYERPAKDNIIPIKNEESRAVIKVRGISENGLETEKVYTVTFKAKQPRLTSFVCEEKTYYPVFVGGAAAYDDSGTVGASDRNYIVKDISPELIGGSTFLFPVNNKEQDTWWNDNTSGTYFTFSADTPGTVYVLSQSTINNDEYKEDINNKKWKSADVSVYKYEYSDDYTRVNNPDYILTPPENDSDRVAGQNYASRMKSAYSKKFRAGETVEIYHTGNNAGVNDPKVLAVVVWNGEIETIASLEGISSQLDKKTPLLEQIPTEITATTEAGEKLLVEVEWNLATYDENKVGWQNVSGTVIVPQGYVLKGGLSDEVTARVIVLQDNDYLSTLKYFVDGKEISVPDFDPKTLSYTVELPDYTNTVKILADGSGTIETYVLNNRAEFSTETVDYGKMTSAAKNVFIRQRPAKDNIIPVRNEESLAVIKVKNTLDGQEYEMEYTVVFKSRQIRLTSFSTIEEKAVLKPVFVSGAAVYDDGRFDEDAGIAAAGSVVASDREQICVEMPDKLRGASSFLFPVSNKEPGSESDPETNNWWYKHNEGAYFSFTAEQGGTIYIFAQNSFKNSEYTEDSHGEGWEKSNYSIKLKNPEVTWSNVYARSFRKGETVKVYHTGNGGSSSANAYKITGIVVWDDPIICEIEDNITASIDAAKEITAQLPKTVKAVMKNGSEIDADVVWDVANLDGSVGEHTIKGKITDEFISENEYVLADGVKNEITLTVTVALNKLKSVDSVTTVKICQGDDLLEKLSDTVKAKTVFDESVICTVAWDTDGFDNTAVGITEITGTITPPDGIEDGGLSANVKVIVRYSDDNIVFALENGGIDASGGKWIDLSKYGNDVTVPKNSDNIKWTENGLYTTAGVSELLEIPLSDEIKDAIMSHKFIIEFELADILAQPNGETPLLTADIEYKKDENTTMQANLIINYNDNKKRNDFKFGGNLTKYWAVGTIGDITSPHINKVEVSESKVCWVIDGASVEKTLNKVNITDIKKLTFMGNTKITSSNTIGGKATWKSLRIYKVAE